MRVVVTGASGAVGRHVADRLASNPAVTELVGLDRTVSFGVTQFDLLDDDLSAVLREGDTIVHLATWPTGFAGEQSAARNDVAMADRIVSAAADAGAAHLVLASSAMVYGAWADNPLPITEAAPVRPNPEFRFGVVRTELEQMGAAWQEDSGGALTILRAATTLARGRENGLANLLRDTAALRPGSPRTSSIHGWSPTTACGRSAGNRSSRTKRPTLPGIGRAVSTASRRSVDRNSQWAPPVPWSG